MEVVEPEARDTKTGEYVAPECTYGMDECGCPPCGTGLRRVVGRRGTKTQHCIGSANRENVTTIIVIRGDGVKLHPTIIFKAKHLMKSWTQNNVSNASYVPSLQDLSLVDGLENHTVSERVRRQTRGTPFHQEFVQMKDLEVLLFQHESPKQSVDSRNRGDGVAFDHSIENGNKLRDVGGFNGRQGIESRGIKVASNTS